jgi:hypothetical protein
MLSISTKVEQMVAQSPFLTEGMQLGLINLSELARRLRPQIETDLWKPVSQAAVVMALRRVAERFPQDGEAKPEKAGPVIPPHMAELTTRSELMLETFLISAQSDECRRKLFALAQGHPDNFVSITRGAEEMLVVISRALQPEIDLAFAGERKTAHVDRLMALTLRLKPETVTTPGIYHAVLKELAWKKVNVITMLCTLTEMTILLEPAECAPAYAILSRIVTL